MHAMVHGGVGLWAATAASPSVLLVPRTVGGSSRAPTVGFKALLHKAPGSTVCSGWECDQDLWGCWGCMESRLLVSGFPICPWVLTACFPSSASCQASWVCFTDQATDLHRRGGAATAWKLLYWLPHWTIPIVPPNKLSKYSGITILRTLLLPPALGINPKSLTWPTRAGPWLPVQPHYRKPLILCAPAVLSFLWLKWTAIAPTSRPLHWQFPPPPASSFSLLHPLCPPNSYCLQVST